MDSDSSPQGVSIYCWFSFQPAKSPLTLCTQGVEGGELTGYWPTELTCHVDSSAGLGPWEITELAFPKATSAPTTVNHLLLREHRIRTVIHTYSHMFLNCYFLWKGYTFATNWKVSFDIRERNTQFKWKSISLGLWKYEKLNTLAIDLARLNGHQTKTSLHNSSLLVMTRYS